MSYKDELYRAYVSTHINSRKGAGSIQEFQRRAKAYDRIFGRFLPADRQAKILDLGCGPGSIIWWLQKRGFSNSSGVDISREQVSVAHSLGLKTVIHGDVFDYLEAAHADISILIGRDILEHLDKESAYRFIKLSCARLKPGGRLILQIPNAESPFFGRIRYGDFTHELAFTASSISQLALAAGFEQVDVYPMRPVVTGVRSALRRFFWIFSEVLIKFVIRLESPGAGKVVTTNLLAVATKI
jgi:2-polyprenyl-3-methyl-5-hydroxy-6-metoxy-1,4-benzoquinol methylase